MKAFYIVGSILYALVVAFTGKWMRQTSVPPTPESSESLARLAVTEGGGQWVGYMEGLVYFNSPQTGSTLACKDSEISADKVRRKIEESETVCVTSSRATSPLEKMSWQATEQKKHASICGSCGDEINQNELLCTQCRVPTVGGEDETGHETRRGK